MHRDIDRVLIPQEKIAARIAELARQIIHDHTPPRMPDGGEITIVPILTGAMIFCGDLIRQVPIAMKIGLITVSSYPGKSVATQGSKVLAEQLGDIKGRHVLLVDDILDSGGTIKLVSESLTELGAASVKACVLLRKDRDAARAVHVDYVGFDIPDEFVVGYGLDYDNYYRNIPDIVTLKREVLTRKNEYRQSQSRARESQRLCRGGSADHNNIDGAAPHVAHPQRRRTGFADPQAVAALHPAHQHAIQRHRSDCNARGESLRR